MSLSKYALNKNYKPDSRKRIVQAHYYSNQPLNKGYFLGGNNVPDYLQFLRRCGFRNITMFENKLSVFLQNAPLVAKKNLFDYRFCDIKDCKIPADTFMDIDLTESIIGGREAVQTYKDCQYAAFTFCHRMGPYKARTDHFYDTINLFLGYRGEKRKGRGRVQWLYNLDENLNEGVNGPVKVYLFESNKGQYRLYKYYDSCTMYVIVPHVPFSSPTSDNDGQPW